VAFESAEGEAATPRERFKGLAESAIRLYKRNIGDRGLTGPDSALHVGPAGRTTPGLLDVLADAAEAAYAEPARGTRSR
jgi:hypothetical protein